MWRATTIVAQKELREAIRDRRSVLSAMLVPLLGPVMVLMTFSLVADLSREPDTFTLPVEGAGHAPGLVAWLEQNGATVTKAPPNALEAIREGKADLVLRVPQVFPEKMAEGEPAPVELLSDKSRKNSVPLRRKTSRLVEDYAKSVASLRLTARGVDPRLGTPVSLREVDVGSQGAAARILSTIPLFVMLAAFVCGMQVAIDSSAGERERGSLEALLINPVSRSALVLGKWCAAVVFSAVGLTLTLAGCLGVTMHLPLEEIGIGLDFGFGEALRLSLALLPTCLVAPGLQIWVSTFAHSYKEAQTYVSLLLAIPMVPQLYSMMTEVHGARWMYGIPVWGQQLLIADVLSGATPSWGVSAMIGLGSLALGLLCVWMTSRLFKREAVIFGM